MEFDLQQYLQDMRQEQKDDHNSLARTVAEGFEKTQSAIAGHETRIVVQEGFRRNFKWVTGSLLVGLVLPLVVYGITLVWK